MVINKGIFRGFTKELLRYLAVILLIIIGMGFVVGGSVGNGSIIDTVTNNQKEANVESGSFSLYQPLSAELKKQLKDQYHLRIERQWYIDSESLKESTLRVFRIRNHIDLITVDKGSLPVTDNEVLLEKNYVKKHNLKLGDTITLNEKEYILKGIGTTPDYCYVKQNMTDFNSNPEKFGTAFTTKEGFKRLSEEAKVNNKLIYQYSFINKHGKKNSDIIELISENSILTSYSDSDNNSRITAYEDDCGVMYRSTLIFGVIYFVLIGYILSIFTVNKIEAEKRQIGTLVSLGYKKAEILRHYLILPSTISLIASTIGIIVGIQYMAKLLAGDSIELYSFPAVTYECPKGLIVYAVLMPLAIVLLTNSLAINKKLRMRPLEMLHNIPKGGKGKAIKREISNMMGIFRKRQRSSEIRSNVILVVGVLIATLLMILGFSTGGSMDQYIEKIDRVTDYKYIYYMNNDSAAIPVNAEDVLVRNVNYIQNSGNMLDVSLMGLNTESKYFHDNISTEKDEVVVSSAASEKFHISEGDSITLNDPLKSKDYKFTVKEIVDEEKGTYFFMSKESMKDLLEQDQNYNMILSSEELTFDEGQMASFEKKSNIINSAKQMKENLNMMIILSQFCGLVVFLIVVYLLISMMIGRSTYDLSMMKIMGYSHLELIKTYIGSAYVTVFWSCIISIPVGVIITKMIFPYFVSDTSANINPYMNPGDYIMLLIYMLACCIIVLLLLTRKIHKASMITVLKNED